MHSCLCDDVGVVLIVIFMLVNVLVVLMVILNVLAVVPQRSVCC